MDEVTCYNQHIYETRYTEANLDINTPRSSYDKNFIDLKLRLVQHYGAGRRVLDAGCGSGSFLIPAARFAEEIVGVDFAKNLLTVAKKRLDELKVTNVQLLLGDLQNMSFLDDASFDFVFSFTTLYHVPDNAKALKEIARILKKDGVAIFELGNKYSLNNIVSWYDPISVKCSFVSVPNMEILIRKAGLEILEHKIFQILPMYGRPSPRWFIPFSFIFSPRWKSILGPRIGKKMLDEIVSGFPILRNFAFRHLFVCMKK